MKSICRIIIRNSKKKKKRATGMEVTNSDRATGVVLNFPANDDGDDNDKTTPSPSSSSNSPPKLPRRLRRRLMQQQQSKTPITADDIESKLTQARLRRQVALSLSLWLCKSIRDF
ncbi:hypothetical protein FEM48_Zijuj06G0175800 [Ziziphus jujuba var. spinosa]|uniref:Uncharacterized protein n=1 Tax=Ziziphus jujuba var. spinosa TaxID=714518 RepID=A0A978VAN6_ZIZJJ|nr:hypothetical protein FEM48_Zijuj06G0175800 [Ziziphus jujuba var. spinosa]